MKWLHLSVTVLLLCYGITLRSQSLEVVSVSADMNDMTVKDSPRYDINDMPCALLKFNIVTKETMDFSGKLGIVGDVKCDKGIYFVYVPEGTKEVTFKHPRYIAGTIDFSSYSIRVRGGMAYSIQLQEPQSTVVPSVAFILDPENASVIYDGREYKCDNGMALIECAEGQQTFEIVADGYDAKKVYVDVSSVRSPLKTSVKLQQKMGSVNITANIDNASVYADGVKIGGIGTYELPVGNHRIMVSAAGYSDFYASITVAEDKLTYLKCKLEMQQIAVSIILPNDKICIDNKVISSTTVNLMVGKHLFYESDKEEYVINVTPDMNGLTLEDCKSLQRHRNNKRK